MADTDPATGRELAPVEQRVTELQGVLFLVLKATGASSERALNLAPITEPLIRLAVELTRWSVNQLAKIGEPDRALHGLVANLSLSMRALEDRQVAIEHAIAALEQAIEELER